MLKYALIGVAAAILATSGLVAARVQGSKGAPAHQEHKVICCGECRPGDDCLKKCQVIGEVPKDLKLTCCGKCQKGDNCLEKCGAKKASCCDAK